jgi:hypothetical protein
MEPVIEISKFETEFTKQFGKGTVIETTVTDIILPSQIITDFYEGFIGRLSVLDISWCLPDAEQLFKKIQKRSESGSSIELDNDDYRVVRRN